MSSSKLPPLSHHVPARPAVSPRVPFPPIWKNKPNLLAHAATGVADALLADLQRFNPSATSVAASGKISTRSHLPVSRNVPPRPAMSPDVPDSAERKNKANLLPDDLSHIQLAAIRLLLTGKKVTIVARELGISRRTLLRWRQIPTFLAELAHQHDRVCKAAGLLSRGF